MVSLSLSTLQLLGIQMNFNFATNKMRLLKPSTDRNYWIAQDLPFQGFGLTPEEAIFNLEQKIKEHFQFRNPPIFRKSQND